MKKHPLTCKVHLEAPAYFKPEVQVSGCFLFIKNKFLLLHRNPNKPQGETWGIPSGKLNVNETPLDGVLREIDEEIKFKLNPKSLFFSGTLYVEHPDIHFNYHIFYTQLTEIPHLELLHEENTDSRWVTFDEALTYPLIKGAHEVFDFIYHIAPHFKKAFTFHKDPEKANWSTQYMKNQFDFLGIAQPLRKKLQKLYFKSHPILNSDHLVKAITSMWDLDAREFKYVAIDLLEHHQSLWDQAIFKLIKTLITNDSWWDTVDSLAIRILGKMTKQHADMKREVDEWAQSNNIWLKRASILYHIGWKKQMDSQQLFKTCLLLGEEKEFFIQKAIGWALREYRKIESESVDAFILENRKRLSSLSVREAQKHK